MELSQSLPGTEKYVIQATHARVMKDNKKAIEAYEKLAKSMPDNSDVELALGSLYSETGAYEKRAPSCPSFWSLILRTPRPCGKGALSKL